MEIFFIAGVVFVISFVLAARSMKDFRVPKEVQKMTYGKKKRGTFIIYKNKITHYKHK